uniref:Putative transposase-like protein n=1 Tax=Ixodes ricinus TaxID=34613 RepID=A0A6B0UTD0_IXORI
MKFSSLYIELWKVVKILLVLSHGQATVEQLFSVNCQVSVRNLKNVSYVSTDFVQCGRKGRWCPQNPTRERAEDCCVSCERQQYSAYLEAEKKQCEDAKQANGHCIDEEIDTIKTSKRKLEATRVDLTASADAYAEKEEKRK